MDEEQQVDDVQLTEADMAVIDELNNVQPEEEFDDSLQDEQSLEDTPEDGTESQDSEEEAGVEFNPDLIRAADAFGLQPDLYETEDQLRGAIEATKQFARMMQPAQPQQMPEQPQQPEAPQQPAFGFDLGEDVVDPELKAKLDAGLQSVVDHFQQQQEILAQHVLQQQQILQQQYQQAQAEESQRIFNDWDRAVQGLDRKDRYGEGGYQELSKAQQRSDRDRLGQQVSILAAGYQQQGLQVPPMDDLVKQADRMLFAEDYEKMARKEVNERIKKQASRTTKTGKRAQRKDPIPDDPVDNPTLIEWWENNVSDS